MDKARAKYRAKLAEADALLTGLDGFLLDTLGLTPPPKDERKVFAVRFKEVQKQGRINSNYYHPERILALRAMNNVTDRLDCQPLSKVVTFIRDQIKTPGPNYFSLAHVQSHTGERVEANEEVSGACSEFKHGDVLFARFRPYLNKVYCAEADGCCSPEFHVLRPRNTETLLPDYLAAILRSSLILAQTRHMMTGNTHPRLTNEDVVNLVIPIPKPDVQERIAVEVRRRREQARRLRTEAEAGWQEAKRWFEGQLLGTA
ncbi:MAG: restriction endonuclease subunit S [Proteobacteria bacterium]|nr:restriction endonuclease subunit S [Pseudomonadota bacterium]